MSERDFVKLGEYYSADYLRYTNLDNSRTFSTMFRLVRENTKEATDSGVISMTSAFGRSDVSEVFRVAAIHPQLLYASAVYPTSQTGVILIPAPIAERRIVVVSAFMRASSTSGTAYFSDGVQRLMYLQFSSQNSGSAANIFVPMAAGAAVKVTSTQGAKELYVAVGYYTERIKA